MPIILVVMPNNRLIRGLLYAGMCLSDPFLVQNFKNNFIEVAHKIIGKAYLNRLFDL